MARIKVKVKSTTAKGTPPASKAPAPAKKKAAAPKKAASRPRASGVIAEISRRMKEVRAERYGEHGGPELARKLNLPARTWYHYENGVTVPAEVLLDFLALTRVEPRWLRSGDGPMYRGD